MCLLDSSANGQSSKQHIDCKRSSEQSVAPGQPASRKLQMDIQCRPGFKTPENGKPRLVDINGRNLLWAPTIPKSKRQSRLRGGPQFSADQLRERLKEFKDRKAGDDSD
ncbi:hypothetical protein QR680_018162 [Steinernema hermaphroditum]|uniref:Uncharacterized protein n=1 Tax=Steinernema hermaphroditum TaxID=289476 RepID=A0AA39HH27_9BILA|nr:hypothetical protein QR680_018162 [Steinernema hermaphroditum]